jgi:hypothetical protein
VLKTAYPEYEWQIERFSSRGKKSMQGWYERMGGWEVGKKKRD